MTSGTRGAAAHIRRLFAEKTNLENHLKESNVGVGGNTVSALVKGTFIRRALRGENAPELLAEMEPAVAAMWEFSERQSRVCVEGATRGAGDAAGFCHGQR